MMPADLGSGPGSKLEQLFVIARPGPAYIPAKSASFFCSDLLNKFNGSADNLFLYI